VTDRDQGPAHRDPGPAEIDVRPLETEDLAAAHPGRGGQQPEGIQAITLDGGEERPQLGRCPHL
jgi:hypothetical protein